MLCVSSRLQLEPFGELSYPEAQRLQQARWQARVQGGGPDTLLYGSHPPTITLGRLSREALLHSPAWYAARNITLCYTDRGGRATFHGPGQLVVYPVLDLRRRGLGIRRYVAGLEEAVLQTLGKLGFTAEKGPEPGIFIGACKVASFGITYRKGVTLHGLSLNISTDPDFFRHFVPCGDPHLRYTSLQREGLSPDRHARVAGVLLESLCRFLDEPIGLEERTPERQAA